MSIHQSTSSTKVYFCPECGKPVFDTRKAKVCGWCGKFFTEKEAVDAGQQDNPR